MPRYAMVIDLQRCVGCSACSIACRNENNVPDGIYWSNKITETSGTFPNVRYHYIPTLCNHCENAPCVRGCPTGAMHKLDNGITMHDPKKCIGCKTCMAACPYGSRSMNYRDPRPFIQKINPAFPTRTKGVVEKCNFCEERLARGLLPACVAACQDKALVFGDLDDSRSEVRLILDKNLSLRRRPELGTGPQVYYIL